MKVIRSFVRWMPVATLFVVLVLMSAPVVTHAAPTPPPSAQPQGVTCTPSGGWICGAVYNFSSRTLVIHGNQCNGCPILTYSVGPNQQSNWYVQDADGVGSPSSNLTVYFYGLSTSVGPNQWIDFNDFWQLYCYNTSDGAAVWCQAW